MSILKRILTSVPAYAAARKIKNNKALLKIKAPDIFEGKRDKLIFFYYKCGFIFCLTAR